MDAVEVAAATAYMLEYSRMYECVLGASWLASRLASYPLTRAQNTATRPSVGEARRGDTSASSSLSRSAALAKSRRMCTAGIRHICIKIGLINKLADTTWGAATHTLRTFSLALAYSVTEYCVPVWAGSAHTEVVDIQLRKVLRTISGTAQKNNGYPTWPA
ncbi:hypothetical protein QTP88_028284 [Uroleucon formosanum]